jgi:carboxyl-terminal processing protease
MITVPTRLVFSMPSLLLALVFMCMISSCHKTTLTNGPDQQDKPKNFGQVFDSFWTNMNRNYVYWDTDTTDWNAIYKKYKPLFSSLDLYNRDDVKKSVALFRQVCLGLTDSHFYMKFINNLVGDSSITPGWEHLKKRADFHGAYSYFSLVTKYLDPNYSIGYDSAGSQGHEPLFVLSGRLKKNILYFGCNQFSISRSFNAGNISVRNAMNYFFENLSHPPDSLKAVIIDLRNNSGGDLIDLNFLMSHLINKPFTIGYSHSKSNINPLDYSPWIELMIKPYSETSSRTLAVILLTDIYSASVSEIFATAMQNLPNCKIVGEQTFGATGSTTSANIFNNGSFEINNYAQVQLSSVAFKSATGLSYEGKGVPPDVYIPYNLDQIKNEIDVQLEAAIKLLQ